MRHERAQHTEEGGAEPGADDGDRGHVGRVGVQCERTDARHRAQGQRRGRVEADGARGSLLEQAGCDHAGDGQSGDDDARVSVRGPTELGLHKSRPEG